MSVYPQPSTGDSVYPQPSTGESVYPQPITCESVYPQPSTDDIDDAIVTLVLTAWRWRGLTPSCTSARWIVAHRSASERQRCHLPPSSTWSAPRTETGWSCTRDQSMDNSNIARDTRHLASNPSVTESGTHIINYFGVSKYRSRNIMCVNIILNVSIGMFCYLHSVRLFVVI